MKTSDAKTEFGKIVTEPENIESGAFDLEKLRLSQNYQELVGTRKALLTVPVRKPGRQDFIRVRPGDEWCLETAVIELKEAHETYLVAPYLWAELPGEVTPKALFTVMDRQGVLSLWPIRLPGEDGRLDNWNRSALEAAEMAKKCWIRLAANMSLGANEVFEARGDIPEPTWPAVGYKEIVRIAFKGRYIDTVTHPVIRLLRGES